jgi:hypothetical protein
LRCAGMPIARLMARFQISKASVYRYLHAGGVGRPSSWKHDAETA